MNLYLDIETDFDRQITIIGLYARDLGVIQLSQPDISRTALLRVLPRTARLYTFNGFCFDLPCIKAALNVDLRSRFESIDLRFVCQRLGWRGGQKHIEQQLGIERKLPGLDGRDAIQLWSRWSRWRDQAALTTLFQYNREDLLNMSRIRAAVRRTGVGC